MFKLTSSVPVPSVRRGRPFKYPFHTMRVGQSFIAPPELQHTLRVLSNYHKRRGRGEFTCSLSPAGIRVWRTA